MLPHISKRRFIIVAILLIIDIAKDLLSMFDYYPMKYGVSGILASAALLIWLYCMKRKLKALALVCAVIAALCSSYMTISIFENITKYSYFRMMDYLEWLMPNIAMLFPMLFTLRKKRSDNKTFFIVATIIAFVGAAFSLSSMMEIFMCLALAVVFMPKFDGLSRQSATSESALERFKREHGMK